MQAAAVLAFLAMALTGGCLGNGAPDPGAAVVTVTQEVPPNAAGPTPTWQQWVGEQVAKGECGNSSNTATDASPGIHAHADLAAGRYSMADGYTQANTDSTASIIR